MPIDIYYGIVLPAPFGGGFKPADLGSGDRFGFVSSVLGVPRNYISGSRLDTSMTFAGQTFAALGASPGTYSWSWGSGGNADSFVLNIGPAAAVPETASTAPLLLGLGGLGLLNGCTRGRPAAQN